MMRKDERAHHRLIEMVNTRVASRRSMLLGAATVGTGLAAGVASRSFAQIPIGTPGQVVEDDQSPDATPDATQEVVPGDTEHATPESPTGGNVSFNNPVDVLNYALTLEHLEAAFYRDGLADLGSAGFEALGFHTSVFDNLSAIAAHEAEHVDALTATVNDLGGTPVEEATYDFGYADAAGFLQVALALEDTGVAAYGGAAQFLIDEDDLLTAALTIHGVEARHASYLALLNETVPFPDATNAPLTPAEVFDIATPFMSS
jgi:hypothetical protein